jgi:hypothetical protein
MDLDKPVESDRDRGLDAATVLGAVLVIVITMLLCTTAVVVTLLLR